MQEVKDSPELSIQVVATGGHFLREQGLTLEKIVEDGFTMDGKVDIELDVSSTEAIAASMGRMGERFAEVFGQLKPDYVAVLGDRYELLPIVNTAFVMGIPIIHFFGGDVTEGAIDDGIRNAVTMLSQYHFPATYDSAYNISRMRGSDKNIWRVGASGLDYFNRKKLIGRKILAENLSINLEKDWCLFTFHSETKKSVEYNLEVVRNCFDILEKFDDLQVIATYSNADYGGRQINEYLEERASGRKGNIIVIPSLGNLRYLSIMKQVKMIVGNSSSGIIEAPYLGVPVVNIGDRQKGRHMCDNIFQTDADPVSIDKAINQALTAGIYTPDGYWGDGHTAERVISIMERELV